MCISVLKRERHQDRLDYMWRVPATLTNYEIMTIHSFNSVSGDIVYLFIFEGLLKTLGPSHFLKSDERINFFFYFLQVRNFSAPSSYLLFIFPTLNKLKCVVHGKARAINVRILCQVLDVMCGECMAQSMDVRSHVLALATSRRMFTRASFFVRAFMQEALCV